MNAWCIRRKRGEARRDLAVARPVFFFVLGAAALGFFFLEVAAAAGAEELVVLEVCASA